MNDLDELARASASRPYEPRIAQRETPPRSQAPALVAIAGVTILALCVMYTFRPRERTPQPAPAAVPAVRSIQPVAETDASTLMYEFVRQPLRAREKYGFKLVDVVGVVDHVDWDSSYGVVVLGAGFRPRLVKCAFGEKDVGRLASLKVGQLVTIRGRCIGLDERELLIMGCRVHAVHQRGRVYN